MTLKREIQFLTPSLDSIKYQFSDLCTYDKIIEAQRFITFVCVPLFLKVFDDKTVVNLEHMILSRFGMAQRLNPRVVHTELNQFNKERIGCYHSIFHCIDLARRVYEFTRNKEFLANNVYRDETIALMIIAAFYHDIDHTKGQASFDIINIGRAVNAFTDDVEEYCLIEENMLNKEQVAAIVGIISATKFPYEIVQSQYFDNEVVNLIRVLDALQSQEVDCFVSQIGLYNEMRKSGAIDTTMKISEFLIKSAEFVDGFLNNLHSIVNNEQLLQAELTAAAEQIKKFANVVLENPNLKFTAIGIV